jgi:DNA ligase D-like protein (predicted 3'-phosphoesterase)
VLRSWAVPKGPSLDPAVKRLAVQVRDHALAHGQYEGDTVIVWDAGTFRPLGDDVGPVGAALDAGHLSFWLDGMKLKGGFTLQRTHADPPAWLLLKRRDAQADASRDPVVDEPASVRSGRTL